MYTPQMVSAQTIQSAQITRVAAGTTSLPPFLHLHTLPCPAKTTMNPPRMKKDFEMLMLPITMNMSGGTLKVT
jgi:hypothetical protein